MTLSIQEIIDGFKNKRDETYRQLVCLRDAKGNVWFEKPGLGHPPLTEPQLFEFNRCQSAAIKSINRMVAILISGSNAGIAPNPHQKLREHLKDFKSRNETIENTSMRFSAKQVAKQMDEAIELLDKIEG